MLTDGYPIAHIHGCFHNGQWMVNKYGWWSTNGCQWMLQSAGVLKVGHPTEKNHRFQFQWIEKKSWFSYHEPGYISRSQHQQFGGYWNIAKALEKTRQIKQSKQSMEISTTGQKHKPTKADQTYLFHFWDVNFTLPRWCHDPQPTYLLLVNMMRFPLGTMTDPQRIYPCKNILQDMSGVSMSSAMFTPHFQHSCRALLGLYSPCKPMAFGKSSLQIVPGGSVMGCPGLSSASDKPSLIGWGFPSSA